MACKPRVLCIISCVAALLCCTAQPGEANTTAAFTLSGTAIDDCSAPSQTDATAGLNFAPFDPLNPATIQATAHFSIDCSNGTLVKVYLSSYAGGDRAMSGRASAAHKLYYQIYESDFSTPWPTTVATAVSVGTSAGKTTAIQWALYGQLDNAVNGDAAADAYGLPSDAVTMSVMY